MALTTSEEAAPARWRAWRRLLVDISPLRESPRYRRIWIGQALSFLGTQMTAVALPVQIYRMTGSAFAVGLVGLVTLVPVLVFGLLGGAIIDATDVRRVLLGTAALLAVGSATLAYFATQGITHVWPLYAIAAFQAAVSAVDNPGRGSLPPRLLPPERISAAAALGQLSMNASLTVGPLVAGVLIAAFGLGTVYTIDVLSYGFALYSIARLGRNPAGRRRAEGQPSEHHRGVALAQDAAGRLDDLSTAISTR